MYSATSFGGKIEEDISDHLIGKRVVYELRVDIHPSDVMVQSFRAAVINRQNYIAYRINKKPTSEDWCYSRKVLNGKHQTQSILKSIWKSTSHLLDSEFWMLEFVKYSLVSKRAYNTNYFDEVSIAMLCIIRREKIIELLGKYKAWESCSGADFEDELNNCVGYKVKLLFDRNKPHQLTGFAVLFDGDRKTVLNHPEAEAFAGTSLSIIVKS